MNKEHKEILRSKILEKITESKVHIASLEEVTKPIAPENSIGRISRMDAINNKSVSEAALRQAKKKLVQLKVALTNIDQPGFGMCIICKQDIPEARLMFMPESNTCVRCADRH